MTGVADAAGYYELDDGLANLLVPPASPTGLRVELGRVAITALTLTSVRSDAGQNKVFATYQFAMQATVPVGAVSGTNYVTLFHKSFQLVLALDADFIDSASANGSPQGGQVLSPITFDHDVTVVGNTTTETLVEHIPGDGSPMKIFGKGSTFDLADWALDPTNGNLTQLINNWNRAWANVGGFVQDGQGSSPLGYRKATGGGFSFAPFFGWGADLIGSPSQLPGALASVVGKEKVSQFHRHPIGCHKFCEMKCAD